MTRTNREPLSNFILTLGAADMVIGGVGDRASLFLLGLATAGVGLLLRWARLKQRPTFPPEPQLGLKRLPPATPPEPADSHDRARRGRRIY